MIALTMLHVRPDAEQLDLGPSGPHGYLTPVRRIATKVQLLSAQAFAYRESR